LHLSPHFARPALEAVAGTLARQDVADLARCKKYLTLLARGANLRHVKIIRY
jgi:hypothetical protein